MNLESLPGLWETFAQKLRTLPTSSFSVVGTVIADNPVPGAPAPRGGGGAVQSDRFGHCNRRLPF